MKKIRTILIIIIAAGLIILAFRMLSFLKKTASINGIAYLEISETKVKPLKSMTIYLIRGKISGQLENIKEDYQSSIGSLKEEVELLQKSYYEKNEIAEREFLMLKRYEQIGKKTGTYREQKKRYESRKEERDKSYHEYYALLEEYSIKRNKFIKQFEELIRNDLLIATNTDERGKYGFHNINKGTYYIYAVTGTLVDTHLWFIEINLDENKSLNLSKRNASDIFE